MLTIRDEFIAELVERMQTLEQNTFGCIRSNDTYTTLEHTSWKQGRDQAIKCLLSMVNSHTDILHRWRHIDIDAELFTEYLEKVN